MHLKAFQHLYDALGAQHFKEERISENLGEKNVEVSNPQFRPKISTPLWWTTFVCFPIDRKHFLYHSKISWLKTILILGSQIVETSVHGEHKVRKSQLISLYLVNWEFRDNCSSFVKVKSTEFLPELWPSDKQQRTRATRSIKISINKGFNMLVADKLLLS